ncbi:MAG: GntR family transcriptional regulator [Planctomycetota bacterium]|nr:GntR family transcriptional regulator [Planctomycetota bacterium]
MSPRVKKGAGRIALKIAQDLQARIASGELAVGQYLPTVRDVALEHKVSRETARRAMKHLASERWVAACHGHGFRVTVRANDPSEAAPIALVISGIRNGGRWSSFCQNLQTAMHRAAESRGWSVLSLSTEGREVSEIVEQLRIARASGLLLDTPHASLLKALARLGMPAIMVEELGEAEGLDSVTQDNFGGALASARYLIGRGRRRIGWYGIIAPTVASRERLGGAMAALSLGDSRPDPRLVINAAEPDAAARLRELLSIPERPDAIVALWWNNAAEAARVALDAGLALGRDIEFVSWCVEEQMAEFRAAWPAKALPATVTWSMRHLAEEAMARLAFRRNHPGARPARILVETKLLAAEAEEGSGA